MQNKFVLILLLPVLVLFFTACGQAPVQHHVIDYNGKQIVFIGDSITAGTVAEPERYVNQFAAAKGASFLNMGISGQVLQNGTGCGGAHFPIFDMTTIPTHTDTDAALFIALGTNDIGVNNGQMTPQSFQETLASVVHYANQTRGWPLNTIVLLTPFKTMQSGKDLYSRLNVCGIGAPADQQRADAYAAATRTVGLQTGVVVADIYSAMAVPNYESLISNDGIHPNASGNTFIANFLKNGGY